MDNQYEPYFQVVTDCCMEFFRSREGDDVLELATRIMAREGFPMHAPVHHYLVPAVLLSVCRRLQGHTPEVLERDLEAALERARQVPGGACGFQGACGAGVGVGIFFSVITDSTPISTQTWAQCNRATGKALMEIAAFGGPRCCKRCTYLALESAVEDIHQVLGLQVSAERSPCQFSEYNQECLHLACPYHVRTGRKVPLTLPVFAYPRKNPEHPCPCEERPVELTYKTGTLFWKKMVGQTVRRDEVVAELEVEKKTLEITSPLDGILDSRTVQQGDEVQGSAVIGYLMTEDSQ